MNGRTGQHIGNYQLSRLLGHGGFAEVYLAEHRHLKTPAAIKLLSGKLSGGYVQAFMAEAQIIAQLRHPHIVRVLDFGFEHTMPFLVMEYLPGGTLRDHHPQGSRAPLNLVASYVQQIASALAYAHARKLIHRDVKPENLLLAENDILQLSDFGIVAVAHSTASMNTIDSSGTVHYMAPEQIQGRPSPASDQYALAVCVYEWLSGERPFTGSSPMEIAMKQLSQEPPPLRQKVPALAERVEQVVLRALAKEPKDRFATIQDFADAFTHAYHGADETTFRKPPVVRDPPYDPATDYNKLLQARGPRKAASIVKSQQLEAMRTSMLTQYPWETVARNVRLSVIPSDWSVYFYNHWNDILTTVGGMLGSLVFIVPLILVLQRNGPDAGMITWLVILGVLDLLLLFSLSSDFSKLQSKDFVVLLPRGFIIGKNGDASCIIDYTKVDDLHEKKGDVIVTLPGVPDLTESFGFEHFEKRADLVRHIERDYLRFKGEI
ncbi:MAG: serine/threonine protein kinase [Ktedonobacteraceae bacterium]|nr:serine/threonine protein kinase [Ktedonobacteraceae bacterium]MBO0790543.1 serine/threonine protein kinase [Ktedonobacteraceae bacterium]